MRPNDTVHEWVNQDRQLNVVKIEEVVVKPVKKNKKKMSDVSISCNNQPIVIIIDFFLHLEDNKNCCFCHRCAV